MKRNANRYFCDNSTVMFENLIGGCVDDGYFVPVRFGLKHKRQGGASLYLIVDQQNIDIKNGSRGPKGTSRTACESRYLSLCFQKEYRYAYGSVEPLTGENFFLIMPYCNTVCMNIFLRELSKCYPEDIILCCDGAAWHKSAALKLPENIVLFLIPPYAPEMNPIEQIWKEIRKRGFRNEVFATLEKVVDRLCDTICSLRINAQKNLKNRTTFHIT